MGEVEPGGSTAFPARRIVRRDAPVVRADGVPAGMVEGPAPRPLVAHYRRRETGLYGEAQWVEEWKPLPPRLHSPAEMERPALDRTS